MSDIKKVLIADDESPKLDSVSEFVRSVLSDATVSSSRSVRSTLARLREEKFDLLILDMSLPTFDVAPGEKGGRAQNLGGEEVLRYMEFYSCECPVIIVTQFDHFYENGKHVGLNHVTQRLRIEHPTIFRSVVHYGGFTSIGWRNELISDINAMKKDGE